MSSPPHLDDTISFSLRTEKVVVNKTVKITVQIVALSQDEASENQLRADIKAALAAFIPDAEWQISGIYRTSDDSGYERVQLTATARVDEKENYNLDTRAKKVSKTGLQLLNVQADTTVPQKDLDDAEHELRATIVSDAQKECGELSKAAGVTYRVKSVSFGNGGDPGLRKMAASNVTSYGSGVELTTEELSNAQKISLSAQVVLGHAFLVC